MLCFSLFFIIVTIRGINLLKININVIVLEQQLIDIVFAFLLKFISFCKENNPRFFMFLLLLLFF
jgi:hypothetical protein